MPDKLGPMMGRRKSISIASAFNFPIDAGQSALQLGRNKKKSWRVIMDRTGSYAVVASLVLLSALHIVSAPVAVNILPAVLGIFGLIRLATVRTVAATPAMEDLALTPTAEA